MAKSKRAIWIGTALTAALFGCGGYVYTSVGGSVSGLVVVEPADNTTLVVDPVTIRDSNGYTNSLSTNTNFLFSEKSDNDFSLSVYVQPVRTNCTFDAAPANAGMTVASDGYSISGHLSGGGSINNVKISCVNNVPISGIFQGLYANRLTGDTSPHVTLNLNGVSNVTITGAERASGSTYTAPTEGGFVFPSYVVDKKSYSATVIAQPAGEFCTILNGSGIADKSKLTTTFNTIKAVTDLVVSCVAAVPVAGTVSGLAANDTLVVTNNNVENFIVSAGTTTPTGPISFQFPSSVVTGSTYLVTVKTPPTGKTCNVVNGSGTADAVNGRTAASNIAITCS